MLNARMRKVWADVWINKVRTALVILTITASLAAVGIVLGARERVTSALAETMNEVAPAHVRLDTDPYGADLLEQVRIHPLTADAEGRFRIDTSASSVNSERRNLRLYAIPNFEEMQINKLFHEEGAWPPRVGEIALERATTSYLGVALGDTIEVETRTGTSVAMVVGTILHDPYKITPIIGNEGYGYVVDETLPLLDETADQFNELYLHSAQPSPTKSDAQAVGIAVRTELIEPAGLRTFRAFLLEPNVHPLGDLIQVLLVLLLTLGIVTLFISGFLIINTITAILTEQTRQIGVMKAMGATSHQLIRFYLILAFIFGLIALIPALLLSWVGGFGLAQVILNFLNLDGAAGSFPWSLLGIIGVLGLLLPIGSAFIPARRGARLLVLDAIRDDGITAQAQAVPLTRALEKTRFFSRSLLLALRNIFRRRGRLVFTLLALTLGGAMFISMLAVRASMTRTIDDMTNYWQYDIAFSLNDMYPFDALEQLVQAMPDVSTVEGWMIKEAFYVREDKTENQNLWLFAPSADSTLIEPTVRSGRWLTRDEGNTAVVNTDFLRDEPNVQIGDTIELRVDSRLTTWQVVGVVTGQIAGPVIYVNYDALAANLDLSNQVNRVVVATTAHDEATQTRVRGLVEEQLRINDVDVGITNTNVELRAKLDGISDIFFAILMSMIALLAITAGLSMAGTMSLNVLERTREIGILRAVGASSRTIRRLVLLEAICIALLGWLLGTLVGIPLSKLLSDLSGLGFINAPLNFTFPLLSVVLWFVLAIVMASLATLLPAYRATRLSVRDALTYE